MIPELAVLVSSIITAGKSIQETVPQNPPYIDGTGVEAIRQSGLVRSYVIVDAGGYLVPACSGADDVCGYGAAYDTTWVTVANVSDGDWTFPPPGPNREPTGDCCTHPVANNVDPATQVTYSSQSETTTIHFRSHIQSNIGHTANACGGLITVPS